MVTVFFKVQHLQQAGPRGHPSKHLLFFALDFFGQRNELLEFLRRGDEDTIIVTNQHVARMDRDTPTLDGNLRLEQLIGCSRNRADSASEVW